MSDPSLTPASLEDAAIQRAERHLRVLAELTEIGLDLTRALKRRVEAQAKTWADEPPPSTERDPADAFQRLSRSVRLTLAMEARVAKALRALIAGEAVAVETRHADKARAKHRETAPARVVDLVTQAMRAEIDNQEALYDCREALEERLEEDEAYEGYIDRPLRETVERLCADLGLTPDWSLWTEDGCDEGWAFPSSPPRPAHSVFNQPRHTPYWRDQATAEDPPLPPRLE